MGSFNETCGVSGLPIGWKTPCRIFVIRPHSYLPLHYQSVWEPLVLGSFPGIYDDYGKLKSLEDGPAIRTQHRILRGLAREFPEETRKRHWEIFKRYPDDPSAILELCERGVLNVFTPHGDCVCAPFYVREDVYRHVIDLCRGLTDFWGRDVVDTTKEMVRRRFEHHDAIQRLMQEGQESGDFDHKTMARLNVGQDEYESIESRYLASEMLRTADMDDPEVREDLAQAMIEFEIFSDGMDRIQVTWGPKTYRGQESDYRFHAEWHRALARLADEAHHRLEEE